MVGTYEELGKILRELEESSPVNLSLSGKNEHVDEVISAMIQDAMWENPADGTELLLIAAKNNCWNIFQYLVRHKGLLRFLLHYNKFNSIAIQLKKIAATHPFFEHYTSVLLSQSHPTLANIKFIHGFANQFLEQHYSLIQLQFSDEDLGENYIQTCNEFTASFLHTVLMIGLFGGEEAEIFPFDNLLIAKEVALAFAYENGIDQNDLVLIINALLNIFRMTSSPIIEKELQNIIKCFKLKIINNIATAIADEKELLQPLKKSTLFLAAMMALNLLISEIKQQDNYDCQDSIDERYSRLFLGELGVPVKEETTMLWKEYFSDAAVDLQAASSDEDWVKSSGQLLKGNNPDYIYDGEPEKLADNYFFYNEGISNQSVKETVTAQLRTVEENILLSEYDSYPLTHILENYMQWSFPIAFTLVIAASNNLDNVFGLLQTDHLVQKDINDEIWLALREIDKNTNTKYVSKLQAAINNQLGEDQDFSSSQGYSFLNMQHLSSIKPESAPFIFNLLAQAIASNDERFFLTNLKLEAIKAKGKNGDTLLHIAVRYRNAVAFHVLVNFNADLNAINKEHRSVWHLLKQIDDENNAADRHFLYEISRSIYGVLQEETPGWIMRLREQGNWHRQLDI